MTNNELWSLKINFKLENDEDITIPYVLYDSPYLKLWINQWRLYKKRYNGFYFWCINKTEKDLPVLYNAMHSLIEKINNQDSVKIPVLEKNFSQRQFNEFHSTFEERCHNVNLDLNQDYMKLNSLIHTIEAIYTSKGQQKFRSIIGVLKLDEALPLTPEYQLFSHQNTSWGDLTMSYATTGKNWLEVFGTNDTDLIKSQRVTNKTLIRQEFVTHFELTTESHDLTTRYKQLDYFRSFYSWYKNLDPSLQEIIPIDNLNELGFRNLYLGSIDLKNLNDIDYNLYIESTKYRMKYQKDFNLKYINKIEKINSLSFQHKTDKDLNFIIGNV